MDNIKIPWSFVKNHGQEDAQTHFTVNLSGRNIFFSSDRLTFVELENRGIFNTRQDWENAIGTVQDAVALELSFLSANTGIIPVGITELEGRHHYFIGTDQSRWTTNVFRYEEIRYPSVWPGIDLEVCKHENSLKMNWLVERASNVTSIQLHWQGADSLAVDTEGNLLIHHILGTMTDRAPVAYQEIDGKKINVDCAYRLDGNFDYGFDLIGTYDPDQPIIIDPFIEYSTFLGGNPQTTANKVAVDSTGCAYLAGFTSATDFPVTPGAFQTTLGGEINAFITKFSADGSSLVYSTFLGGSNYDSARSIAVDDDGYAYVTGISESDDFPVTPGAFQTTETTLSTPFITKLSQDGSSLVYSTFLGGDGWGNSITVDRDHHAYVAGETSFADFPVTPEAFQTTLALGSRNAFITKFAPDGGSLVFSTYLGGSALDGAASLTLDAQNNVYVAGQAQSSDFPVTSGAFQDTRPSLISGFVSKLSANGEQLIFSTYLGGNSPSTAIANVALGLNDTVCVTGNTSTADFPITPNAFQTQYSGPSAFISILSADATSLVASTFLGSNCSGSDVVIDQYGRVYVAGTTNSADFPITPAIYPSSFGGVADVFVSILTPDLSTLLLSFFLGGLNYDVSTGIALESKHIYVTGYTASSNFPTTPGAYQESFGSGTDYAFLTKFAPILVFLERASLTVVKLG